MRELKEANDATSNEGYHQRSKFLRRPADGVVVLRAQPETSGKNQLVRSTNVTEVAAAPLPMPPAATVALPGRSVSAIVPVTTGSTTVLPLLPLLHAHIPAATQSANPARTIQREWTATDMAEAK